MIESVCVFCGSRPGRSVAYAQLARDTGRSIARRGWRLVYGGGDIGLMGILATAVLEAGGEVIGILPRRLLDREVAKGGISELVVTATMFERKERMISGADAFLVLPGGFGTLDELLEVVTLRQLGYHDKPIVLVDVDGFWQPCLALFDRLIGEGFADPSTRRLWSVADGAEEAFALLDAAHARGRGGAWRAREDSNL